MIAGCETKVGKKHRKKSQNERQIVRDYEDKNINISKSVCMDSDCGIWDGLVGERLYGNWYGAVRFL